MNLIQQQILEDQKKNQYDQLVEYRNKKHASFINSKQDSSKQKLSVTFGVWEDHSTKIGSKLMSKWGYKGGGLGKNENGITSPIKASAHHRKNDECWPKNTTLIIGDSIINGIEEQRLRKYNAHVIPCPGAKTKDIYNKIAPFLKKKPSKVIVHVGTNDTPYKSSHEIMKELTLLRTFIESNLPGSKIFLSCPIMRLDNHLANSTIRKMNNDLREMPNVIMNDKIDGLCLGRKGLHLNRKGCGILATNFIKQMQCV